MTVVHLTTQPGPPGDPVTQLVEPDAWDVFETPGAKAWVLVRSDSVYLLHWIESYWPRRGLGTTLLLAIAEWADLCGLPGQLTCHKDLAPFYRGGGWEFARPWGLPNYIEMWRQPR